MILDLGKIMWWIPTDNSPKRLRPGFRLRTQTQRINDSSMRRNFRIRRSMTMLGPLTFAEEE
jgi:hypothetical protein